MSKASSSAATKPSSPSRAIDIPIVQVLPCRVGPWPDLAAEVVAPRRARGPEPVEWSSNDPCSQQLRSFAVLSGSPIKPKLQKLWNRDTEVTPSRSNRDKVTANPDISWNGGRFFRTPPCGHPSQEGDLWRPWIGSPLHRGGSEIRAAEVPSMKRGARQGGVCRHRRRLPVKLLGRLLDGCCWPS
jgi:hypothetical protein